MFSSSSVKISSSMRRLLRVHTHKALPQSLSACVYSTALLRDPHTLTHTHTRTHTPTLTLTRSLGLIDKKPMTPPVKEYAFETLPQLLDGAVRFFAKNDVFGTKHGAAFEYITYEQFHDLVHKSRTILKREFDIAVDDKVAIISNNRVEWASLMFGAVSLGAQFVPMYEAQLEKDWKHIIEDSGAKLLVVANRHILNKVAHYPGTVGHIQHILCLEDLSVSVPTHTPPTQATQATHTPTEGETKPVDLSAFPSFPSLLRKTQEDLQSGKAHPPAVWEGLTPQHCALIIYTSGTTGLPKGAELSHQNIVSDVHGARAVLGDNVSTQRSLAFLPWAHVYGFTTELQCLLSTGSCLAIVPHRDQILECLQLVKPTVLLSVPMLFNMVYDGIMKNVSKQHPLKQKLFHHALSVSRRRNAAYDNGESASFLTNFQHKIFDKVLFSKIREKLGGNLVYMASGGAAAPVNVIEFFDDIDIPIIEGYGLTETSPIIASSGLNRETRKIGTVGVVLPEQEVRIVDPDTLAELPLGSDGEIVVSGPNVMLGYRNNAQANAEVFFTRDYTGKGEEKRFFRTGDMGRFEKQFLRITGRIKEQFKLENGKYVVPAPLEDIFSRGPFVQQCYLYGSNKKHTVMLVVPNYPEIYNYAKERGIDDVAALVPYHTVQEVRAAANGSHPLRWEDSLELALFKNENWIHLVTSEILRHSVRAKSFECPTVWMPVHAPFSVENQLLTPKLSLRRKNVLTAYQPLVEGMYAGTMGHRVHYKPHAVKNIEM